MTDEQAKLYVDTAQDALEKRIRMLEVGLLRHTSLFEQLTQALEKLTAKLGAKR